jgi:thiamine pyrophosphate-dependent acetolactate synthase large subunit-like protein
MTSPHETAHGGDRVAQALKAHGVPVVFTLCGGHISPILVAAKARGIRIVDTRDEVTAVFAADATARLTGIPGVAAVTAGPGLTNTITALKNAQLAQSPLLLIGGAAPTALQGRGALQDIDQRPLIAPHVKLVKQVRRVADLGPRSPRPSPPRAPAFPVRCSSNARWISFTKRPPSASGTPMPRARARRSPTARCAGT